MSWLRSLLLVCVMTLILYGVYAWLVSGSGDPRPAPPPELAEKGATTEKLMIDSGEPAGDDPFGNLGHSPITPGASVLPEGNSENPPNSIANAYTDTPLPGNDPLYPSPSIGTGNHIASTEAPPRYGTDNSTAASSAGNNHAINSGAATEPSSTHEQFQAAVLEADRLIREERLSEAHLALSKWHGHERLFADDQQQLYEYLDGLAGVVIYSQQHLLEPEYKVLVGDSLLTVADEYQVPAELLAKINGVETQTPLTPGTTLKVIRGPFKAEVSLKRMELTLFLSDGRYAGRFPIGVGQEVPPTEGVFSVTKKLENPDYYQNEVVTVPGGDPNNPFGARLLTLGDNLALHGTNDPQSIGPRPCDEGCIRLGQRDIADVYDILNVGSEVQIIR
ncbi:MAG: L,D-transpeptidase family protein [Pirellulales bacterium]|nr:L,D-transpeptidase family protein [Pirellulales bacterium]